ncbi:MAG: hypothetical protein IKU62_03070 [Ruminiclostridium sp.]|nr:hypothetical protein [Ruminiclostridium sp.]
MVYCPKCKTLSEGTVCGFCGSCRVRLPGPDDYCLLTEQEYVWASLLDEVLRDNGIPVVSMEVLDQPYGLRRFVHHRVYVPYGAYEEAKKWMTELLDSPVSFEE